MIVQRDAVFLAISEAERWATSFERPFDILLGDKGFTPELVDMYAKEFMVARTLNWSAGDERGKGSNKEAMQFKQECKISKCVDFAELLNSLDGGNCNNLLSTFDSLIVQVEEHDIAKEMWKAKAFPSALSKFFMARSQWIFPPFDSHAANCLGVNGRNKTEQARAFYNALDQANYVTTIEKLSTILQGKMLNTTAARILDKLMILDGFKFGEIARGFSETQAKETIELWQGLAIEIEPLLRDFYQLTHKKEQQQ